MVSRGFKSLRAGLIANDTKVRFAVRRALRETAEDMKDEFENVVAQWSNKPRFETEITVNPTLIEAVIKPAGKHKKIFKYVDMGTKGPYLIPKIVIPGKLLKFRTGYSARTAPIAKYNVGSGSANGTWVAKAQVTHPGIKGREFSEQISKDNKFALDKRVNEALKRALG